MNIFTASMPDINPDQFMINSPAPSTQNNDNAESSSFAKHVNDAERSASRPEDKPLSKPEPKKNENDVKTVHSENRPEDSQETEDTNKGQQISENDHSKDESGTEAKGTEEKTEKKQEVESVKSDLEGTDVKGDAPEETDNADNETGNDIPQIEEPVIVSYEQALSTEINIPKQGEEQFAGTINNNEEESSSGELNSEDGQSEEFDSDNKAFNKNTGFGNSDFEELPEEFDLNEDLKEKAGLPSTKELPDRYAKKTVTDPTDFKQVQSQMNITDPDAMDELNEIGSDQDGMLFKNMQSFAYNGGISNAFKGMSDTSLNSLESINTNTTMSNAELAQNQGIAMSGGKAGAGLMQGNAARAAGFSELLSQVVYVAKGKNKLDVKINHEEFGKLKINVSMDKGILNIHVNASEKVVREFLESNVHNIIESLSKDGVSVGGFSVALKDYKDDPEKKILMDSGLNRQYEHIPAAVNSARGLVNVFA